MLRKSIVNNEYYSYCYCPKDGPKDACPITLHQQWFSSRTTVFRSRGYDGQWEHVGVAWNRWFVFHCWHSSTYAALPYRWLVIHCWHTSTYAAFPKRRLVIHCESFKRLGCSTGYVGNPIIDDYVTQPMITKVKVNELFSNLPIDVQKLREYKLQSQLPFELFVIDAKTKDILLSLVIVVLS